MNTSIIRALIVCIVALGPLPTQGQESTMPPEAKTLYQQGFAAAGQNQWPMALEDFAKAHGLARDEASIYYALGVAHDKVGDLLPAMAWYVAYIAVKPDGKEAAFARERIPALDMSVQGKLRAIFVDAENIAKVAGVGGRPDTSELMDIGNSEQRDGLIEMARATLQLLNDSAPCLPAGECSKGDYRYSALKSVVPNLYVSNLEEVGDIATMRKDYPHIDDDYAKDDIILAEITHFLLMSDPRSRVRLAEALSRHDPLQNIDVKVGRELRANKSERHMGGVTWFADRIADALFQIRALRPSQYDEAYLSAEAQDYVKQAIDVIRRNESPDPSPYWWGKKALIGKAWFAARFAGNASGDERLTLYLRTQAFATYEVLDNPLNFGLITESAVTAEGDPDLLVWTRKEQGKWKIFRKITRKEMQRDSNRNLFVNQIGSFDSRNGWATLKVGEDGPGGVVNYSWRVWDLVNNRQVKILNCSSDYDTCSP